MTVRRIAIAVAAVVGLLALCVVAARGADVYTLPVPAGSLEAVWRDALAKELHGTVEHRIPWGRVDVLTGDLAIEIDYSHKWHECLGQAIHYGLATERIGVMALIDEKGWDAERIEYAEQVAKRHGIKVITLRRKQ